LKRFSAFLLLACSFVCFAQAPQIKAGAAVYIEPMGGYETYLAAAIAKKNVPLIVVADKDKAEYIIRSNVSQQVPAQPAVVVNSSNVNNNTVNSTNVNNGGKDTWEQSKARADARRAARAALGSTNASISVIDAKSSQVVFAYSVDKHGTTHQSQSAAEACAKHLKEFIEKSEKPKK
jgi:hypothetical protein